MSEFRVHIRSSGMVSALGPDRESAVAALRQGRDGLLPIPEARSRKAPSVQACSVPDAFIDRSLPRADALALMVVREALRGATMDASDLRNAGLFVGTVTGDALESEVRYRRELTERGLVPCVTVEPGPGALALRLADRLGIGGPVLTVGTACTSSANALLLAFRAVQQGSVPRALVLGVDLLTATLIHGFESLMLLDPEGCRPFDRNRKGIQLGEGAAALVIEALGEGSRVPALLGGAFRCLPHHLTASEPDGGGAEAVMRAALADARLSVSDLVAVKSHGTGTPDNDLAEGRAMARVFEGQPPPWTGIKRSLGHTMGASGALETVAMLGCLEAGFLPACKGFAEPDPEIGLAPIRQAQAFRGGPVLFNWFGFGGNSASLVIEVPGQGGGGPR